MEGLGSSWYLQRYHDIVVWCNHLQRTSCFNDHCTYAYQFEVLDVVTFWNLPFTKMDYFMYLCPTLENIKETRRKLVKLFFQTLIVQVRCFKEIIDIGYAVYRIHGLPWFRSLSWYFLLASNYFFYGEGLVEYFGVAFNRTVSTQRSPKSDGAIDRFPWYFLGLFTYAGGIPQVHFILLVLLRVRVVRAEFGQQILHEAVFPVCVDARRPVDRGHAILLDNQEHFRGSHLVRRSRLHDHLQRYNGVHLRVFLRENASHQVVS